MALGTIPLKSEFKSDQGHEYLIYIYDSTSALGNSQVPFVVDSQGFTLTYKGKGKERYDTIKESNLEVNMYFGASGTAKDFIDALQVSDQGRFKINVQKKPAGSSTFGNFWRGVILADIMTINDESAPSIAKIKATDGLSLMKDIKFDRDVYNGTNGNVNSLYTIRNFVGNMFKYYLGGTEDFFNETTTTMWYELVHWYEDTMPAIASSNSPWEYSAVYPNAFRDIEYDGADPVKTESISAYDTLKSILEAFGCRVFQASGVFWIVHHDTWRNDSSLFYYRRYAKNGSELGSGTLPATNMLMDIGKVGSGEPLIKLAGGTSTFYPPIIKSKAVYSNWTNDGLYSSSQDLSAFVSNADMETNLIDLGYVESSGGAYLNLNHRARTKKVGGTAGSLVSFYDYVYVIYMIKVGIYYWNEGTQEWQTTQVSCTKVLVSSMYQYNVIDGNSIENWSYQQVQMQTADLPVDGEAKYFARFIQGNPYTDDGNTDGNIYDVQIMANTAANPSLVQYTLDGSTPFERTFATEDTSSNANEEIDLGNMRIGDGPTTAAPSWGRIRIYNGSDWLNTIEEDWQAWETGNTERITQILTEQNFVGQRDFTNIYEYNFVLRTTLNFTPLIAVVDKTISGDPTMVLNGYKFIANTDEVKGEYYQTKIDASSITNTLSDLNEVTYTPNDYY